MTPDQDERLLAQQFETIFTKYYSVVKYFALMLLKSEEDAKDITQDVFTKLWTKPELWAEVPNPTPYIYTLTKSTTLNFIKHKSRIDLSGENYRKTLIDELFQSEDTLNPIYYKEAQLIIKLVLERLPEQRRMIFEMSRFKHMSNLEIAEKLNISETNSGTSYLLNSA